MVDVATNRNCVYQTAYHVIWCPMYRGDVLSGTVAEETGAMLDAICAERGWPVISKAIRPDHIHLFVGIPPAMAVADAVKVLKGVTARRLFQRFPALKKRLGGRTPVVSVVLRRHGGPCQRRDHPPLHRTLRACHQEAISDDAHGVDPAGGEYRAG